MIDDWARQVAERVRRTLTERDAARVATYRLQFHREHMTFRDAAALAPYLKDLGVSHLYASPYLRARADSEHGYDVVDYGRLHPPLGTAEDHRRLVEALREYGLGQVVDIVPNHMAVATAENAWWRDVLEHGRASAYADYFDIDWQSDRPELRDRVLLPLLGGPYGRVLEAGELHIGYEGAAFGVAYGPLRFPLDPRTYPMILGRAEGEGEGQAPGELREVIAGLADLPLRTDAEPERASRRRKEAAELRRRLNELAGSRPEVAAFIERSVERINGTPGQRRSFDRLDELLEAQAYRLAHWRTAANEINYRRFFDITDLAALRAERPNTFDGSHRFVLAMLGRGELDGLRVDHIDGLHDPRAYLERLQTEGLRAMGRAAHESLRARVAEGSAAPPRWQDVEGPYLQAMRGLGPRPVYIVVEKILAPDEPLRDDWPAAGTSGYDFLNRLHALFVDPEGFRAANDAYGEFIGRRIAPRDVVYQSKRVMLRIALTSDLNRLGRMLDRLAQRDRHTRDNTRAVLRRAVRETLACFPVYRTYITDDPPTDLDRRYIEEAMAEAGRRNTDPDITAALGFLRGVLLLEQPANADELTRDERDRFIGRFQQVNAAVTAKGVEDTAFYRYVPLVSLNEVGGEPDGAGLVGPDAVGRFHDTNRERLERWSGSLLATTTHDTKRTEDVRARISVLSEVPDEWRRAIQRWVKMNGPHRGEVDRMPAPSRHGEYLFYQTLVGAWPLAPAEAGESLVERLQAYMEKATHEAKLRTSWTDPNPEYDAAVRRFIERALDDRPDSRFPADFRAFHERVVDWGLYTALSQALLKLTSPGVPDIYQGQEVWDFSLVDPDNRRSVDFARRRRWLDDLRAECSAGGDSRLALTRRLGRSPRDPRIKLLVTMAALSFRRTLAEVPEPPRYVPLEAAGDRADHVCAFAWRWERAGARPGGTAVVIAPRLLARLTPDGGAPLGEAVWGGTHLRLEDPPAGPLSDAFTGRACRLEGDRLRVADALADFPVALLV